jgi:hypothetical protein
MIALKSRCCYPHFIEEKSPNPFIHAVFQPFAARNSACGDNSYIADMQNKTR